jgi:hypothetical protein
MTAEGKMRKEVARVMKSNEKAMPGYHEKRK